MQLEWRREDEPVFLEAAPEKVERQKWQAAFDRVLELPAILTGISDPVAWVDNLRAQDEDRLERLGI